MENPKSVCDAGLTDPLLAKQKQHSKKAFELIGKALRLDEENKHGMYVTLYHLVGFTSSSRQSGRGRITPEH